MFLFLLGQQFSLRSLWRVTEWGSSVRYLHSSSYLWAPPQMFHPLRNWWREKSLEHLLLTGNPTEKKQKLAWSNSNSAEIWVKNTWNQVIALFMKSRTECYWSWKIYHERVFRIILTIRWMVYFGTNQWSPFHQWLILFEKTNFEYILLDVWCAYTLSIQHLSLLAFFPRKLHSRFGDEIKKVMFSLHWWIISWDFFSDEYITNII